MSKNCIHLKLKLNRKIWCNHYNKEIKISNCSSCIYKEYKSNISKNKIKGKKHNLTKATEIPTILKKKVWERDQHRCIFCGKRVSWNYANSHFIKRAQLGLGIEENIMTNCQECHELFEGSNKRDSMREYAKNYFKSLYPNWSEEKLKYKK